MEAKNWTKRQHANGFAIVNGDFHSDDVVAHGVSEDRADMILRACNAHDDLVKALQASRRELHACQAVIHLAGGFDPAYVKDAQAALKEIDAALAKAGA